MTDLLPRIDMIKLKVFSRATSNTLLVSKVFSSSPSHPRTLVLTLGFAGQWQFRLRTLDSNQDFTS